MNVLGYQPVVFSYPGDCTELCFMCQLLMCSQTVQRKYRDKKYLLRLFSGENIKYIKVLENFHCGSQILRRAFWDHKKRRLIRFEDLC